jgi:hypothetical protein
VKIENRWYRAAQAVETQIKTYSSRSPELTPISCNNLEADMVKLKGFLLRWILCGESKVKKA